MAPTGSGGCSGWAARRGRSPWSHVVPVLLGHGRRLFDGLAPERIELQRTRILDGEAGVTHMHYRIQ
jgi:hypothetical protein